MQVLLVSMTESLIYAPSSFSLSLPFVSYLAPYPDNHWPSCVFVIYVTKFMKSTSASSLHPGQHMQTSNKTPTFFRGPSSTHPIPTIIRDYFNINVYLLKSPVPQILLPPGSLLPSSRQKQSFHPPSSHISCSLGLQHIKHSASYFWSANAHLPSSVLEDQGYA